MVEVPILVRITAAPMAATPAMEITAAKVVTVVKADKVVKVDRVDKVDKVDKVVKVVKVVKGHNGKTLSALTFKTDRMVIHCLSDGVATAQQIK
jgi:hypothetical protein